MVPNIPKCIDTSAFTDEGDTVIDPCAGSATTLRACKELKRNCYGFEIDKNFFNKAQSQMLNFKEDEQVTLYFNILPRGEKIGR